MVLGVDRLDLHADGTYRSLTDSGGLNARRTDEKYGGSSDLLPGCDVDYEWFGEARPWGDWRSLSVNVRTYACIERTASFLRRSLPF